MLMCPALMSCSDESLSDETPETTKAPKETKEETTDTEPQIETVTPSEAVVVATINNLRDPCVLKANNRYFVFGTGWQGYFSATKDLSQHWIPLDNVVDVPTDSDGDHWAPEVYEYEGQYYMFTTYKSKERNAGAVLSFAPISRGDSTSSIPRDMLHRRIGMPLTEVSTWIRRDNRG